MKTALIILAVILGGWFLFIFGLRGIAFLLRRSTAKAVMAALANETILKLTENASYLGADFPGPNLPPRTSGALAVTGTKVLFLPWFPRRSITLPGHTIAGVSLRDQYGNKAYNIPVLVLNIKGVGDPHGSMAWLTHEPEEWEREINSILE
jgi:hypothetical protein